MSLPTTAQASTEIDAPPEVVYDLIADVTRMGEWSPECVRCTWQGEPGQVGSTFKGQNRSGPMRWSTTARVIAADRPREFSFETVYRNAPSTRWTYKFEGDGPTKVTESFESIYTPAPVRFVESIFIRNRQEQLETGMAKTLARLKAIAEGVSP